MYGIKSFDFEMEVTIIFILCCLVLFVSSLFPYLIPEDIFRKYMLYFNSCSLGVLLSFVFLELLPHSLHDHKDDLVILDWSKTTTKCTLFLIGYLIAFVLDTFTHDHSHSHSHDHNHSHGKHHGKCKNRNRKLQDEDSESYKEQEGKSSNQTTMKYNMLKVNKQSCTGYIIGKFVHSFSEGILVISQFLNEGALSGFMMALSIFAHELPMNFSLYSRFYQIKESKMSALLMTMLCSSAYIANIVMFFILKHLKIQKTMKVIEALTIGILMKLVISEMLPEFEHEEVPDKRKKMIRYVLFTISITLMSIYFLFIHPLSHKHGHDHGHGHHGHDHGHDH